MANINSSHSNLDDCSNTPTKMASSQEEQQSVVQNPRCLTLRKRPFKCYNTIKSRKVKTVQAMKKLLCKPVQINVTRLSMEELKSTSKTNLPETRAKPKSVPKTNLKAQTNRTRKNNGAIQRKVNVNQNQVPGQRRRKRVQRQTQPVPKITRSATNNSNKEDPFENVKQPYIKLNRIEEVINKIAQTFAKVIPNKECSANVNTSRMEEVQTEINTEVPAPSNVNTDKCFQADNSQILISNSLINASESHINASESYINASESHINASESYINASESHINASESHINASESHINESSQPNDRIENDADNSDSDKINRNASRNFKRKRKIVHRFDDDCNSINNEDGDSQKIFSKNIKMLKLSSPEKETENRLADKEYDAVDTRHAEFHQKLDVSDKSHNLSVEQNLRTVIENVQDVSVQNLNNTDNVSLKSSPDTVTKRITRQQINAFTPVPLNSMCAIEREILRKLKHSDSAGAEEQTINNEDVQLHIEESLVSDKSFKAKYNLLKELRICLIELNRIKYTTNNRYSALEIEELTRKYIKTWNCSELVNIRRLSLTDKEMEVAPSDDEKIDIEFMEYVPIYDSNVCKVSENTETKRKSNVVNQEILNDVSDTRTEPDTFDRSGKMSTSLSFSDSKLSSSPMKASVAENVIKARHSEGSKLHNSSADSVDEVHSPNKEQYEILLHTSSPKKSSSDKRSLEHAQGRSIVLSKKSAPAHNEKVLISGRKTFVTKIHAKTVNIINPKVNSKKNITACHSTVVSPSKHKKSMEKKDIHYKCIVCDDCFETYGILQHHLTTHTQKQNNMLSDSTIECSSKLFETSEDLQQIILDSLEPKESELLLCEQESTEQAPATCNAPETNKRQTKPHSSSKDQQPKKKKYFSDQRTKFRSMLCKPSECSICSKSFPTATDLAAHIFLHTERELQSAYKQAKEKKSTAKEEEETETEKSKKTKIAKQLDSVRQTNPTTEKSSDIVNGQKKSSVISECSGSSKAEGNSKVARSKETVTKPSLPTETIAVTATTVSETAAEVAVATTPTTAVATTTTVATPAVAVLTTAAAAAAITTATIPLNTLIILDVLKGINLPAANENSSEGSQLQLTEKSDKKKSKKSFNVCSCHNNKSGISDNCLQIEIVLLCHTCKILFRSIDCFNDHYNLSEYESCKKNRVSRNRTPNLLCATCDVIFKSVQDVRHHLENHARVKQNRTMDFRCTICKVIFIGIGPLFYYHWSKHLQEPCWKADETTFVNNLVANQTGENSTVSTEDYIRIADYVCQKCKIPFVTEGDLRRHNIKCNSLGSIVKVAGNSCSASMEKPLEIEVNCRLCNDVFTKQSTFYKHVRSKHNFISEPQFVCVSLTLIKTAYICNICMEIAESIDDFEDHWLKHSTATVYFTCTYCSKAYSNGLNAFLEHAKTHEVNVKQYVLSCTVHYAEVEFICKYCNIGFQAERAFDEHNIIHKPHQTLNIKNDKVQNQGMFVSDSRVTGLLAEPETWKTDLGQKEVNVSQSVQQKIGAGPTELDRDKDKERLINILEGNEDDSEHELIIDWIEKPEEENQLEEKREKEKQAALNNVQNAVSKNSTVIQSGKNVVQASPRSSTVSVSFKNLIPTSSQTNNEIPRTSTSTLEIPLISIDEDIIEIPQQPKCSNTQSIENNNASSLTKDQVQPTVSKQNSPVKPRHGFLRVKTLAELTDRTKPLETKYPEHLSTYPASNQKDKQNEPNSVAFENFPVSGNQNTPATRSVLSNQQPKQPQTKVNQDKRYSVFAQTTSPAYHKNLPACNIFRTTTAVPRPGQRNEHAPAKAATNNSGVQNQPQTVYATSFMNNPFASNNQRNSNQATSSPQPTTQASNANPAYKRQHLIAENKRRKSVNSPVTAMKTTASNSSQHSKQYEATSSSVTYPCSYLVTANSSRGSDVLQKSQQMVITPPINGDTSTIYYKNSNSTNGGMSIVINQTTPAVQNMPTINIVGQEQQPVYQPQVYTEPTLILDHPYVRQTQNVTDFSASSNVYQIVTNEYQVPSREPVAAYNPHLQPPLFLCSYCPEVVSFTSPEQLEIHLNVAHNFICNDCGQRSYSFNELTIHKMKHGFV